MLLVDCYFHVWKDNNHLGCLFLYLFENWFISVCDFQGTMHSENMTRQMLASVSSSYFCCIVCLHTTEKLLLRGALYCIRQTHIFPDRFLSHGKPKLLFLSSITQKSSLTFFIIWRPPALPHRLQCSTIGRSGLNHRVRDGNGCVPWTHRHQILFVIFFW